MADPDDLDDDEDYWEAVLSPGDEFDPNDDPGTIIGCEGFDSDFDGDDDYYEDEWDDYYFDETDEEKW